MQQHRRKPAPLVKTVTIEVEASNGVLFEIATPVDRYGYMPPKSASVWKMRKFGDLVFADGFGTVKELLAQIEELSKPGAGDSAQPELAGMSPRRADRSG